MILILSRMISASKIKLRMMIGVAIFAFSLNTFAQNFYPKNFFELYTVQQTEENSLIGLVNANYLKIKKFEKKNDSVFTTNGDKELLIFHFKKSDTDHFKTTIDYYMTISSDLNKFLKRLGPNISVAKNGNLIVKDEDSDKQKVVSFSIVKNENYKDQKYHHITFIFTEQIQENKGKKNRWNREHKMSIAYPLQNTEWYFEADYEVMKNADEFGSDKITTEIKLSADPIYQNKIQFIDDEKFVVFLGKDNNLKKITGKYRTNSERITNTDNQIIDVEFYSDNIHELRETTTKKKVIRDYPEPDYNTLENLDHCLS